MPTYLVGPSRPYTNPQDAFNAIPADLAGTGIHEVIIDAGTYTVNTPFVAFRITTLNGSVNDYIHVRAASGAHHAGLFNSGVVLANVNNLGQGSALTVQARYTRVSNINLVNNRNTSGTESGLILTAGPAGGTQTGEFCTIENVLIFNNGRFGVRCTTANNKLYKVLTVNTSSIGTIFGFYFQDHDNEAINCGNYSGGRGYAADSAILRTKVINCWSANTSFADFSANSGFNSSSRNNCSEDSTAPGSNSLINQTIASMAFVNSTTFNFHILSSSVLFGAGVNQSSLFASDIDLETIVTWCIGPDCFASGPIPSTSSSPWINQNTPHEEVEDAETAKLVTKKGEQSPPTSRRSSAQKDAKAPNLKTKSGDPSPELDTRSNEPSYSSQPLKAPKGYKDGFISYIPEPNGYDAGNVNLGIGQRLQFYSDNLGANKEFVNSSHVSPSRSFRERVSVGQHPSGGVVAVLKSNDCIPLFQSHFQKRIGTSTGEGTTYYEFSPNRDTLKMEGVAFGTGSYNSSGTWSAFTISAYKAIEGSAYHFKTGLCDKLNFSFDSKGESLLTSYLEFKNVEVVATSANSAYGSFSNLDPFFGHQFTVDFLGLPVVKFELESSNNIKRFRRVGTSGFNHQFGRYEVTGQATVDVSKIGLAHFGSMLGASSFPVVGTLYGDERNKMVFSMPNVVLKPYELNINNDTVNVPFSCYESEDGGTAPLTIKLWTRNYSASTFTPN
jgi:hypothetical protein